MNDGTLILVAGALLALGIAASLVAGRLRVPGLVLFLGLGMLIGSDVLGLIDFGQTTGDVELARTIGIVALVLILFEGGLAAGWDEIRPVIRPSVALATVGTVATAVIVGVASAWLLDLDIEEGLLLGSIVAATDGAAVFSVLRGSSIDRRLARLLEGESGLNDPVAIVLVLGLIEVIQQPGYGPLDMLGLAATELGVGAAVGLVAGRLAVEGFRRVRLASSGLYPVASIAAAALSFGVADALHGSGFLAVYLAGLALGSGQIPARRTVADFHDGLAWVSQIAVFFTLGLLVFPSDFGHVVSESLLIAGVLMFVARPLAALVSTVGAHFRLGGPARRGADRAGHVSGDRRGARRALVLQHRLLRGACVDAGAGRVLRSPGACPRPDHTGAGAAAAARGGGHDPPPRRRGRGVPGGRGRRHRRTPGERTGTPARGACERRRTR